MKKTTKNGITLYWSETLKAWVTIPEAHNPRLRIRIYGDDAKT